MTHVFEVTLVEVGALLAYECFNELVVSFKVLGTGQKQFLCFFALVGELGIHRVLVQAVDKLDKVALKEAKFLSNGDFKGLKRLLDEHSFRVLGRKSENVDDHTPARLDISSLAPADVRDAHYDVLFDLCTSCQVV